MPVKVTVVGAGKYGSTTVQRIAEKGLADEVVMTDIVEGLPQGLALDMMQSRPLEGFETRVVGSNGYEETAGSDVCVITAGLPRKPGMSRMDLLETNAKIVSEVTARLAETSPDAVLIVVSNPLDEMTALAAEVAGFPRQRVMGQAGMLDTARFRHFVAEELGTSPSRVEAVTLGSHGDTMVPVPSLAKVDGKPLADLLDEATKDVTENSHGVITYTRARDNWFVISGFIGERIFYRRSFLSDRSRVIGNLWIEFPRNMRPCFEDAVSMMSLSFRPSPT